MAKPQGRRRVDRKRKEPEPEFRQDDMYEAEDNDAAEDRDVRGQRYDVSYTRCFGAEKQCRMHLHAIPIAFYSSNILIITHATQFNNLVHAHFFLKLSRCPCAAR